MNIPDSNSSAIKGAALREKFFTLIESGLSAKEAAREIGISERSRTRFLQERRERALIAPKTLPVDDIRKFAEHGHRIEDIATRFALKQHELIQIAKDNGFTFVVSEPRVITGRKTIDLAEVKRLAECGLSRSAIANEMHVDRSRMQDFIRDNNVQITWSPNKSSGKPRTSQKEIRQALEEQRRIERLDLIDKTQRLLLAGWKIEEIAKTLDKTYDIIYRLVQNNKLVQPARADFHVPSHHSVSHVVGKQLVQQDKSEAGDRPCITCHKVFRSWHKRNNQRCDRCRSLSD